MSSEIGVLTLVLQYRLSMVFEWDDSKAVSNKKKHGVSFAEAATAFSDPHALEIFDRKSSAREDRWILVGLSAKSQVLLSARKAVKDEIDQYFSRMKS